MFIKKLYLVIFGMSFLKYKKLIICIIIIKYVILIYIFIKLLNVKVLWIYLYGCVCINRIMLFLF